MDLQRRHLRDSEHPGSCNNLCDTAPDPDEYAARNAADIAWMQDTFAEAKSLNSVAVMLISQADPGFDATDATGVRCATPRRSPKPTASPMATRNSSSPSATSGGLREASRVCTRRLALSPHRQAVPERSGQRLENFTRVETFGDHAENNNNDVQWLKVLVDPRTREVFAYQQQIVPAIALRFPPVEPALSLAAPTCACVRRVGISRGRFLFARA